jgi:hypothetical protein
MAYFMRVYNKRFSVLISEKGLSLILR